MKRGPYQRGSSSANTPLSTNTSPPATTTVSTSTTALTPPASNSSPILQCPECFNVFLTWTKFTQHLETTQHYSARCVECRELLKCFGPKFPYRHEALTGHRGILGTFYVRDDYRLDHPPHLTLPQYCCECLVVFLTPLALAEHLRNDHHVTAIKDKAHCLTCGIYGTIAEMTVHRMDKLNLKEVHKFEVMGLNAAKYLKRCPQLPPWPQEVKSYIILYQCPVCVLLFVSWDLVERHMATTGHCKDIHLLVRARPGHREGGDEVLSAEEFEVLVDKDDPEMAALICETLPEPNSTNQEEKKKRKKKDDKKDDKDKDNKDDDDDDHLVVFQCPEEDCARVFLTHGELFEHMEKDGHHPMEPNEEREKEETTEEHHLEEEEGYDEKKDTSEEEEEIVPSWKWNVSAYEVECSAKKLVKYFGFVRCPHCRRILTSDSEELIHMQMHHPEKLAPLVPSTSLPKRRQRCMSH
ncbi:uncharacterized protein TM35_000113130 [Trypanosoma theileri]|uniref:C2H2-type domain-containing protein n=1 Tax=Trypanosoma theileri TaxID=67003 RepID=A0A1X0NZY5_9TRYP|nr:uncharacterized protein TM35_000113130 [Trypanosoma theileri]ORC89779.1 hypothetical protein TM35_000113130 [Trypanosoma theileri]